MFFYLLFKLGICQCIGRSLCKMCWAACETYWFALEDVTCFLWHKLKNTERINRRRRFRDIERGYSESDFSDNYPYLSHGRKRKSLRERRRKFRLQSSLYPLSRYDSHNHNHHHRRHVRLKTREVLVHVKGGSRRLRNSRQLQLVNVRNHRKDLGIFKRRRLRWLCNYSMSFSFLFFSRIRGKNKKRAKRRKTLISGLSLDNGGCIVETMIQVDHIYFCLLSILNSRCCSLLYLSLTHWHAHIFMVPKNTNSLTLKKKEDQFFFLLVEDSSYK